MLVGSLPDGVFISLWLDYTLYSYICQYLFEKFLSLWLYFFRMRYQHNYIVIPYLLTNGNKPGIITKTEQQNQKRKERYYIMESRKRIKTVIAAEGTTLKNIVDEMNNRHQDEPTTAQNITNKLARKTIRFDEVSEMMDILEYDVIFRSRKDGKEY